MSADVVVTKPLARPYGIPGTVSDALLLQVVREYLMGGDPVQLALVLEVSLQKFHSIVRTGEWQLLQNAFRDEFIKTTGGRLIRLENKLISKIEDYVEDGVTMWFTDKEGQPRSYQREITPKEAVSIALMLNDTNKRIDALKEGDINRKRFDAMRLVQDLEGYAKRLPDSEKESAA